MAEDEVHEIEAEALERAVDGLAQVLAIEGGLHVDVVVDAHEELGGDHVAPPGPAQRPQGLAHHPLRLAAGVDLGVVEEVDAAFAGRPHAVGRQAAVELLGEGDPGAERQHAHLQARPPQTSIGHLHVPRSLSGPFGAAIPSLRGVAVRCGGRQGRPAPTRPWSQMAWTRTVEPVLGAWRTMFGSQKVFRNMEEHAKRLEDWREKHSPGSNEAMRKMRAEMTARTQVQKAQAASN